MVVGRTGRVLPWIVPLVLLGGCADGAPPVSVGRSGLHGSPDGGSAPLRLAAETVHESADHRILAADGSGTVFALRNGAGSARLEASTDGARTFAVRGSLPAGAGFRTIAVLSDGVLLADTLEGSRGHVLRRSADGGRTWAEVLVLGTMQMLTPHSVDELDGEVFLGEYQAYTMDSVPLRLWASDDSGATWNVRHLFHGHRHIHGVRADPELHELYVFTGDGESRTGIFRSFDGGLVFESLVPGHRGSAVDAVLAGFGLLYGQDVVFGSEPPAVCRLEPGGIFRRIAELPGPSYSIHALAGGGFVLGTTREPAGSFYADDAAALWGSADGETWSELETFPRFDPTGYARADVYWSLPDGRLLLQLLNVAPVGRGWGYRVLRVTRAP